MEIETDELLNRPNFCRIAKCPDCGRTVSVSVWDESVSKETKKEYGKMAASGYNIEGVTLLQARNQPLFHLDSCPRKIKNKHKKV